MAHKYLVFHGENSTMVSSWTDKIFCTVCKNGTLSFRRRLHDPDYPATWLRSLRKIRFPSDLVRDYDHWISGGFDEVDLEALLPGFYSLLPKFALAVYAIRCLDDEYAHLQRALVNSVYSTPSDLWMA